MYYQFDNYHMTSYLAACVSFLSFRFNKFIFMPGGETHSLRWENIKQDN